MALDAIGSLIRYVENTADANMAKQPKDKSSRDSLDDSAIAFKSSADSLPALGTQGDLGVARKSRSIFASLGHLSLYSPHEWFLETETALSRALHAPLDHHRLECDGKDLQTAMDTYRRVGSARNGVLANFVIAERDTYFDEQI